jgi:hypothetical protein
MAQSGYTPIVIYHSPDTGVAPAAENLADGELAINTADGLLYYKNTTADVVSTIGSGATGGGTDQVFVENSKVVTTTYAIPSTKNAESVGPITINSGVTVTVSSSSRWVIL